MAHASAPSVTGGSLKLSLADLLDRLRVARARRRLYRETYNELARLSDRELADFGVARASIGSVAWEHACLNA